MMIKLVLETIFIIFICSHREWWRREAFRTMYFIAYRAITSVIRCKNITIYYIKKMKKRTATEMWLINTVYQRKVWMHDASRSRSRMRFLVIREDRTSQRSRGNQRSLTFETEFNLKHDITSIYKWEFSDDFFFSCNFISLLTKQ